MEDARKPIITAACFLLYILGFLAVSKPWTHDSEYRWPVQEDNLGFESRGVAFLDSLDITDLWTGQTGYDKLLIALAQESMYADALNSGLSTPESSVDSYIEARLKDANISIKEWEETLRADDLTIEDAKHKVRKVLLANENVKRKALESINVTEQEIQEFFTENRQKFTSNDPSTKGRLPELYEVREIINQTIRHRKMMEFGQDFINNMLQRLVEKAIVNRTQMRDATPNTTMRTLSEGENE